MHRALALDGPLAFAASRHRVHSYFSQRPLDLLVKGLASAVLRLVNAQHRADVHFGELALFRLTAVPHIWRMDEAFHPNDALCLSLFPELLEQFPERELRSASAIGTYIFHEDYFARFIGNQARNEMMLRRIADYVEKLASSHDVALQNLAAVGILEGLVSTQDHSIAPYLGPASGELLAELLPRFSVDPSPWHRRERR